MTRIEKLATTAHLVWAKGIAQAINRPVKEEELSQLGRVPYHSAYEQGYRQAIEDAAKIVEPIVKVYFDADGMQTHSFARQIRALPDQEEA